LQTFDIVVANPPYSIKSWTRDVFQADRFGRVSDYDIPPKSNADYAFVLHIIKSLNTNGRAGVVLPHGVLFRGAAEGRIRKQIIENDLIEAVIALPAKLFYGVGISVAVLIFNKNKPQEKKNKILFIDAEKDYKEGKNQNSLRVKDIEKIVSAYDSYKEIEKYARIVGLDEIKENDYNLNIKRYVDSTEDEIPVDVKAVWQNLQKLEKERKEVDKKVEEFVKELGYG